MIELLRLDGSKFHINAIHIETVEATPDTVITLFSGRKFVVRDRPEAVVRAIVAYQQEIAASSPPTLPPPASPHEAHAPVRPPGGFTPGR